MSILTHTTFPSSAKRLPALVLFCLFCAGTGAQEQAAKIVVVGEINVGSDHPDRAQGEAGSERLFEHAKGAIGSADVAFATLGTVFLDTGGTPGKPNATAGHRLVKMPESHASALRAAGFTAVSLSNRRIADFGIEGLTSTANALRNHHIEYAGIRVLKEHAVFERRGIKYGYAAFGSSAHTPAMRDSADVRRIVARLKEECDIVVVSFCRDGHEVSLGHARAGDTRTGAYIRETSAFAHHCVDAGADLVFGSGNEHMLPVELYKDRLIVYGLGRFCTPTHTALAGDNACAPLLTATLSKEGYFKAGSIGSFRQVKADGPRADPTHQSAARIKELTADFFPGTALDISASGDIVSTSQSATFIAMRLIEEGRRHLGKRYRSGAAGPSQFDCSGFTSYVFGQLGYKLKRSSRDQYTDGRHVDRSALMPGDLVFFTGSASRNIGHVGIVVSTDKARNSFRFMHATPSNGITTTDFATSAYYIRRYVGARRIIEDSADAAADRHTAYRTPINNNTKTTNDENDT